MLQKKMWNVHGETPESSESRLFSEMGQTIFVGGLTLPSTVCQLPFSSYTIFISHPSSLRLCCLLVENTEGAKHHRRRLDDIYYFNVQIYIYIILSID